MCIRDSCKARKMLDEAGYPDCKICASNSLDEYIIRDMIMQGAQVDTFGAVSYTHLIVKPIKKGNENLLNFFIITIIKVRKRNMKHTVFTGSAVALVTPMHPDLSVNYEKLG